MQEYLIKNVLLDRWIENFLFPQGAIQFKQFSSEEVKHKTILIL